MNRQFTDEETQIVKNYAKRGSILLVVRDVLIKTTSNFILSRLAKIKTLGKLKYW